MSTGSDNLSLSLLELMENYPEIDGVRAIVSYKNGCVVEICVGNAISEDAMEDEE